jgi:hypothetical protein
MNDKSIMQLFKTRDKAVKDQDRELFISTQVDEIERGSSEGYLGVENLKTEVLHVHQENELETIVFVKEIFSPSHNISYASYIIYYLVNTVKGWKIYKVKY